MYYPDFTPYISGFDDKPIPGVYTIGWLEPGDEFSTGTAPDGFADKLASVMLRETLRQMRGIHYCNFCYLDLTPEQLDDARIFLNHGSGRRLLGSAEVWVPHSSGIVFAAPDLIWHYVTSHSYLPPQEYIEAVFQFDLDSDWSGEQYDEPGIKALKALQCVWEDVRSADAEDRSHVPRSDHDRC